MKKEITTKEELADVVNQVIALDITKPQLITIEPVKNKRSLAINSLYWMWIAQIRTHIMDVSGRCYVADAIHEMLKELFLEPIVYEFRGTVIKKYSSKVLNNKDFTEYLNKIDRYSANDLNLLLSKPQDLFDEAMGRKVA